MWPKTRRATESHPSIRRGRATQYFDRKGRPQPGWTFSTGCFPGDFAGFALGREDLQALED
ncbi:MAG: hypothetical protein OXR72_07510 [Gemmatimonadota bacterium]|nr:hypothetical protein [Gemmatimonadota bacterium]